MSDRTVPPGGMIGNASPVDPRALLIALNQASYDWCLETDRLAWSAGAARVLGIADETALATGRAFAQLLDFDAPGGRHEAILHSTAAEAGDGSAYCLRYACRAAGSSRRRWIEDRGRWFAGPDGRPALARGLLRVVAECEEGEEAAFPPRIRPGLGLHHVLARAGGNGRPAGLLLVAVQRLDAVAAEHGAVVADALAAQVMRNLRRVMRIGDDLVSIADGKFALVLAGCEGPDLPLAAERFRQAAVSAAVAAEAGTIRPSVAVGGAVLAPAEGDAGAALHRARHALERCESQMPADRITLAEGEGEAACAGAARLLACALDEDRIVLAFDPVVDLGSGGKGGRSLFRARPFMRMPDGAAQRGAASWQPALLTPDGDAAFARRFSLRLVDLAEAVLAQHPGAELVLPLPEAVIPTAGAAEVRARLTLELDEARARADLDRGGVLAAAIRASGARLAIAGFGAGHLSFEAVQTLRADRLTLHGALVETATQVAQGRFALRSLVEAAVQRSIAIGADWVDDDTMARLLAGWGCDRLLGAVAGPLRLDLPRPQAARRQPHALRMTGT